MLAQSRDAPADDITRADLGALRVPVDAGLDLQVEVNEAQQVVSATLTSQHGSMQLGLASGDAVMGALELATELIVRASTAPPGQPAVRATAPARRPRGGSRATSSS